MAEERRTKRGTFEERDVSGGLVVRVSPGGRLEWVVPETADHASVPDAASQSVKSTVGTEIISAQEQALITANRETIAELRTRPYPSPDLQDVLAEIMARTHPPTLTLAVAAWVLQATGLVPIPIFESAALVVGAGTAISRRVGHRLHAEQVPAAASEGAAQLWQDHPGLALGILTILMGSVIDSIKTAMSVDDTQLEDELDAFYPRWSRTDFEFDPRRYQR
jgi:hypothetical protein